MNACEVLREVAAQAAECPRCRLSLSRKHAVPGDGPANATIFLIGESPGFYENEQGLPFVGPSGKYLDELLAAAGVNRKEVFMTNVVKCRPPGNRDPQPEELAACAPYLERQIDAINPLVIVTLGRYSMAKFMPNVRISDVHGRPALVRGRMVIPMFHPAAALRQFSVKTALEYDFSRLPEWLAQARQGVRPPVLETEEAPVVPAAAPQAEALSLFSHPGFDESREQMPDDSSYESEEEIEEIDETEDLNKPTQLGLF